MDARTLEILSQHPELDRACQSLVRLGLHAIEQKQHGKTGALLEVKKGQVVLIHEIQEFSHVTKN